MHHLPLIDALPENGPIVIEARTLWNEKPGRLEFGVFDVTGGTESLWKLPPELLDDTPGLKRPKLGSPNYGEATWASSSGVMLVAHSEAIYMVHLDGAYSQINLFMPGKLSRYDGMSHYALSPDASEVAYALYTRDRKDKQPDEQTGKLYWEIWNGRLQRTDGR